MTALALLTLTAVSCDLESASAACRLPITFDALRAEFHQPDMRYAPYAFWFFDAPLDSKLVAEMARKMASKGMNPGYIHARSSAAEPYCATLLPPIPGKTPSLLPHEQWLSPQWFDAIGAALGECEASRAHLGFCDDYWWPMGRADGKVLQQHPELKALSLGWDTLEAKGGDAVSVPPSFFVVAAQLAEPVPPGTRPPLVTESLRVVGEGQPFSWTAPEGRWRLYVFHKLHQPGLDRGDVNYLDRRLAPAYIEIAYKPYEQRMGDSFGRTLSGVFCDHEGSLGFKLAWSDDVETLYLGKTGQELRSRLPLLFEEDTQGTCVAVRWNWYDTVSDLYADGFLGALKRWCEDRGLYFTGHTWEAVAMQAAADGDFFKTQRAFSMPGQDCLGSSALDVRDFKEGQSVAEFEGRRFMSEIMGVAGWQQTPALMKQVANAVTAWGVSHVIPHGVFLDREVPSIPFPSDWFEENPFWAHFDLWADFVRRASFVNSCGHLVPDVLVVSPMDSVWVSTQQTTFDPKLTNYDHAVLFFDLPNWITDEVKAIEETYSRTLRTLTGARTEYLVADRYYIDRMTVDSTGALLTDNYRFRAVVLPRTSILPIRTLEKIAAFAEAGGLVLYTDDLPRGSAEKGWNDPAVVALNQSLQALPCVRRCPPEELPAALASAIAPQVAFERGAFPMLQSHRLIDGRHFFWLANNEESPQDCRVLLRGLQGLCSIWNCEDGHTRVLSSESLPNGDSRLDLAFAPLEAFWLVVDPTQPARSAPNDRSDGTVLVDVTGPWRVRIERSAQTPLTPDTIPFYSVDWTASWLDTSRQSLLRYGFVLADNPVSSRLLVTSDEGFTLWVNGHAVPSRFGDDLWSQVTVRDVTQHLQAGRNVIAIDARSSHALMLQGTVRCVDGSETSLASDATWLSSSGATGDWFAPRFDDGGWSPAAVLGPHPMEPWIDVSPAWLSDEGTWAPLASWSQWGLGAFSGFVDYEIEFDWPQVAGDEILDLGKVKHMAEVWVNDRPAGRRLWAPFEFEAGPLLTAGKNRVRVRVGNLIANVMNEFGKRGKLREVVGLAPFSDADFESGLLGPVRLLRRPEHNDNEKGDSVNATKRSAGDIALDRGHVGLLDGQR